MSRKEGKRGGFAEKQTEFCRKMGDFFVFLPHFFTLGRIHVPDHAPFVYVSVRFGKSGLFSDLLPEDSTKYFSR